MGRGSDKFGPPKPPGPPNSQELEEAVELLRRNGGGKVENDNTVKAPPPTPSPSR